MRGLGQDAVITDPIPSTTAVAQSIDAEEIQLQSEISSLKLQLTELERKYREEKTMADQMSSDKGILWERLASAKRMVQELNLSIKNLLSL